ncbi:hypothetical protein [Ferrovum sp.]|uniref:hypothetical protein n=1 Tax=Ferrovum sp. TaxID=2609467 RepID=UPI00261C51E5|nr:hypothetical protein [Ferrovum sp.]
MNEDLLEAQAIVEEYEIFLLALNGIYLKVTSAGEQVSLHSINEVDEEATGIAMNFMRRFMQQVDAYLSTLFVNASETLIESLNDRREEVKKFAMTALTENIQQVRRQMRLGRKDYIKLLGSVHGGVGYLVQKKVAGINFVLRDSLGRKYDALTFFRMAIRDFFYQSWIDMRLDEIKRSGQKTFRVVYPDPARDMTISIDSSVFTNELRSKIFHPNSHALIGY